MTRRNAKEARERIDEALKSVEKTGEPIAFERDGETIAVLVSAEDFALFNQLRDEEDKADIEAAEKSLAEPGENIPWERLKADLGL